MRIRTTGDHSHRERTISDAQAYFECNKTRALMLSAELAPRMLEGLRDVLEDESLTLEQKRMIAEKIAPHSLEVELDLDVRIPEVDS